MRTSKHRYWSGREGLRRTLCGVGRAGVVLAAAIGALAAIAGLEPVFAQDSGGDPALTIEELEPLAFGRVTTDGDRAGTVTIDPHSGRRILEGGAVDLGGTYHPARFLVRGAPGARFIVTLPQRVELGGNRSSGSRGVVENFISDPAKNGVVGFDGEAIVTVGATLRLGRDFGSADWQAPFTVFVDDVH